MAIALGALTDWASCAWRPPWASLLRNLDACKSTLPRWPSFALGLCGRRRKTGAEFERDLGLLCVFNSLLAIFADEVEVVFLSLSLGDTKAFTVLPDITLFAGHGMGAVILQRC
jgi:hypothetical protein